MTPEMARTSSADSPSTPVPRAGRQLVLLLGLWWLHMRRRATRIGDAPKMSGVPMFLLLNLVSIGYVAPLVWRAVTRSMKLDAAFFAWHMSCVLLMALGTGVSKGAEAFQLRGMRNDAFLEPLPLTLPARLGLQLVDGFYVALFSLVVPLAGSWTQDTRGWAIVLPTCLGLLAFVGFFVLGQAMIAWARVLGPPSTGRRGAYAGLGLNLIGIVGTMMPLGQLKTAVALQMMSGRDLQVVRDGGRLAAALTTGWLGGQAGVCALYVAVALILFASYRAMDGAERVGFDRTVSQGGAPKALKGVQTRVSLERQMMWRQGGRALMIAFGLLAIFNAGIVVALGSRLVSATPVLLFAGFVLYLGAIQTIGQAGRAARSDLMARPFLSALPLSPHQVLDGKARALRITLIPIFALLALLGGLGAWHGEPTLIYRMLLAMLSMYVAVDGAIGIAFLSSGVGVVGVGGGQASSSFSTQILMMPLLTTVLASSAWAATVSFIAVVAVTLEARRAAKMSVRWLDDSDDQIERETTVWRALLAATAFFAIQVLSARLLDLFEVSAGYTLAVAFGVAALVLAVLTWRSSSRIQRPRFVPASVWWWPLGIVAGAASGLAALQMTKLLPTGADLPSPSFTAGELIAVFVTMVVVAPLAEEYFFRGWLQKAIEEDLPEADKHLAFALGAAAFALAHVGSYGVPQLVLGLIAGLLYARGKGLWPAILAHAMHNGVVLLAGP